MEVENEITVASLKPDMIKLAGFPVRGIIVTARSKRNPYDFVSRFFAPNTGIDEDPVSDSAHCALAPYWNHRLGREQFFAYQSSTRGGELKIELHGSCVLIGGQAITIFEGQLD